MWRLVQLPVDDLFTNTLFCLSDYFDIFRCFILIINLYVNITIFQINSFRAFNDIPIFINMHVLQFNDISWYVRVCFNNNCSMRKPAVFIFDDVTCMNLINKCDQSLRRVCLNSRQNLKNKTLNKNMIKKGKQRRFIHLNSKSCVSTDIGKKCPYLHVCSSTKA